MLVELKSKSQVTIPKNIVSKLNLSVGDKFEITEVNGNIVMVPVVIYPQNTIDCIRESVEEIKYQVKNGETAVFDDVEELFKELDK